MFTILDFTIKHKGATLYDCQLGEESKSKREKPLTTLIIGSNGSGKSFLLSQLADFFRALFATLVLQKSNVDSSRYEFVRVRYAFDGEIYDIAREGRTWSALKNSEPTRFSDVSFPSSVIALSFMTNDKFVFSSEEDPYYKYIGVRASSNSSYTSSVQKRVAAAVLQCLRTSKKRNSLKSVLDFLGYKNRVRIEYSLLRKTLFTRPLTANIIQKKIRTLREQKRYLTDSRIGHLHANAENIITFVAQSRANIDETNKLKLSYEFDLDILGPSDGEINTEYLRYLEELEFISAPQIVLKKTDNFGFENASSGEKHFLFTMLSLTSAISKDALILIDEPELSLHPGWQMKYIKYFKEILADHESCHCLLATHSHFMVSDLEPSSSNVLILREADSIVIPRTAEYVAYSTFAWSAENILYKVFQLRTARNFYFGQEIGELLSLISERSHDLRRMTQLVDKFEEMKFDKHDPLNEVIQQARIYLANHKNA